MSQSDTSSGTQYIFRCSFFILPGKEQQAVEECAAFWEEYGWGNWRILTSTFRSPNQPSMELEIEIEDLEAFMDAYTKLAANAEALAILDAYGRKFERQRAGTEILQISIDSDG